MVDMSMDAVHNFWSQYHDKMIYRVIAFMEGVEQWTLDGNPQVEQALAELSKELDNIQNIDLNQLGHEDLMIQICCHLKTGRVLRMLQAIDTIHPGSASKVLIHAEENSQHTDDPAGLFLRRNIVFERLRLLGRVFSAERCAFALRALEGDHHG